MCPAAITNDTSVCVFYYFNTICPNELWLFVLQILQSRIERDARHLIGRVQSSLVHVTDELSPRDCDKAKRRQVGD